MDGKCGRQALPPSVLPVMPVNSRRSRNRASPTQVLNHDVAPRTLEMAI
jgi:hypothetical protein